MSSGCGYCGRSGHSIETCEERLKRRFGTPGDPSAAMADQTRTDGGLEQTESERTRVGDWMRDECDVYAGRGRNGTRFGSAEIGQRGWLGNPYSVDEYGREECIEKFRDVFERRLSDDEEFREAIRDLAGKRLGCWCQRLDEDGPACHAEVIAEHADRLASVRADGGVPDLRSHLDDALERAREDDAELATLAFATEYVEAVRAGEKTVTLRRPGAYDVAVRHAAARDTEIVLVDDGEPFARAEIRAVWKVDAEAVAEARLAGYLDLACADDVVRILERHYELEIEGDAEHVRVHAIHFDVTELLRPAVLEGGEA